MGVRAQSGCEHNANLRTLTRVHRLEYANPILVYADNYLYTMGVWAQRWTSVRIKKDGGLNTTFKFLRFNFYDISV